MDSRAIVFHAWGIFIGLFVWHWVRSLGLRQTKRRGHKSGQKAVWIIKAEIKEGTGMSEVMSEIFVVSVFVIAVCKVIEVVEKIRGN